MRRFLTAPAILAVLVTAAFGQGGGTPAETVKTAQPRSTVRSATLQDPASLPINAASGEAAPRPRSAPSNASAQIHVQVYQLIIPEPFREQIYAQPAAESARTEVRLAGRLPHPELDATERSGSRSRRSSLVTKMRLNDPLAKSIVESAKNERAELDWTPAVILIDGQTATIHETTSNPFVVQFSDDNNGQPQPNVGAVATGNELACKVLYDRASGQLRLTARWTVERIASVREETLRWPGQSNPMRVQIPEVRTDMAQITEDLDVGQWLWVDPHLREERTEDPPKKWHQRLASVRLGGSKPKTAEAWYTVLLLKPKLLPSK